MINTFEFLKKEHSCVLVLNNQVIYESFDDSMKEFIKYTFSTSHINTNSILVSHQISYAVAITLTYHGFRTIYAKNITKEALELLEKSQINVYYQNVSSVTDIDDLQLDKKLLPYASLQECYDQLLELVE